MDSSDDDNQYMTHLTGGDTRRHNNLTKGGVYRHRRNVKLQEFEPVRVYSQKTGKLFTELDVAKNITVGAFKDDLEKRIAATVISMHSEFFFPYTEQKKNSYWSGDLTELLFKCDEVNLNMTHYPFVLFIDTSN
jgi:hypothetical protein